MKRRAITQIIFYIVNTNNQYQILYTGTWTISCTRTEQEYIHHTNLHENQYNIIMILNNTQTGLLIYGCTYE